MVVLRVVALVLGAGLVNRLRAQAKRLRTPRYAIAVAVGLLYWWWYVGRLVFGRGAPSGVPAEILPIVELGATAVALATIAVAWLFGSDRSSIAFTEAEQQFLLPAPLGRRALLHYKLVSALATTFLGSAITALLFGRALSGSRLLFALGAWVAFATLSFHRTAAALTHAALVQHGVAGLRRRLLTVGGVVLALAALAWAGAQVPLPALGAGFPGWAPYAAWAAEVRGSLLGTLLWPVRASVALTLAPDGAAFLRALPGALLVLALHYAWVMSSSIQLEEAAVDASRSRARREEELRRAGNPMQLVRARGKRRPPFALAPRGRPEVAFLWKGLIAAGRFVGLRALLLLTLAVAAVVATVLANRSPGATGAGIAFASTFLALSIFAGPGMARFDLRSDLPNLEALRALPVRGAALVRGMILAPAAVLTVVQWALVAVAAAALGPMLVDRVGPAALAAYALAAALALPAVTLVMLVIQNAFAVLFPAWMPGPKAARGPEAMGLGILQMLASFLALGLALAPAAGLGLVAALLASPLGAPAAALAGAAVLAAVVAGEVHLATAGLGRAFDRLDVGDA